MQGEELLKHLAKVAEECGLTVWQWLPGHVGAHAPGSLHLQTFPGTNVGRAFDAFGPYHKMVKYRWYIRHHHPYLTEGIYNLWWFPLSIKYGKRVKSSFWGRTTWLDHKSHIHIGI